MPSWHHQLAGTITTTSDIIRMRVMSIDVTHIAPCKYSYMYMRERVSARVHDVRPWSEDSVQKVHSSISSCHYCIVRANNSHPKVATRTKAVGVSEANIVFEHGVCSTRALNRAVVRPTRHVFGTFHVS
jgi:hypothetical protein